MRFKTEIEVVSLDEHEYAVKLLSEKYEEAAAYVRELKQDFQTYREESETAAAEQTDWKKQCEDLMAERDSLMEELRVHCRNLDYIKVQRDGALERVNTQAQALKKAAELNLQLKEEVERLRGNRDEVA